MTPAADELIQVLKGHSGCRVELRRRGGDYLVRKTSASPAYNPRLARQIEKQRRLAGVIPVAAVLGEARCDGLVSFDMEFVAGRDFKACALTEPVTWTYAVVERLFAVFAVFADGAAPDAALAGRFEAKCAELQTRISILDPLGVQLESSLADLRDTDWRPVPSSACHGDLTLENMIFQNDGAIVFIDVLDGDLESFWLDIAKLMFDLDFGWSFRDLEGNVGRRQELRLLRMLARYISEEVDLRLARDHPAVAPLLRPLKLLQAARIVPYIHDAALLERLVRYMRELTAMPGAPA